MRYKIALKCMIICILFFLWHPVNAEAAFSAWATNEMDRVGQTDAAKTAPNISLFAAKGEYESYQVIVQAPAGGLTNVNLSVSVLSGPGGATIPVSSQTLFREHYVFVTQKSFDLGGANRPTGPGWFADGLIPFVNPDTGQALNGTLKAANATVAQGTNQPYWIDIFVPRTAQAGVYTGTYTITTGNQGQFQGNVTLTVWNFTLPLRPSLLSSFDAWNDATEDATNTELLRNRIMPLRPNSSLEDTYISQYGLGLVDLHFWSGANVSTCTMSAAPSVSSIQSRANTYSRPGVMLYNFSADEIDDCPGLFPTLTQWAVNLHAAGVKQLVTMTPNSALYNDGSGKPVVDIWSILPKMYDAAVPAVNDAMSRGMQVWSYNALVQDTYSPKWIIDFKPIDFRIFHGFINQSLGLTGVLYWRVDLWTADPWTDPMNSWNGTDSYPGDGMFVYPGDKVGITNGVAPSIRLKWLREGVEDYEYVQLMKNQGKGTQALNLIKTVAPDWRNWNHDPAALESVREQLGQALDVPIATPTPISGRTLSLNLLLNALGNGGDAQTPGAPGNFAPLTTQRTMTVEYYSNPQGSPTATGTALVTFNRSAGNFIGSGSIPSSLPNGSYVVRLKTPRYLRVLVSGFITLDNTNTTATIPLSQATLIVGDTNGDNSLDILDYNTIADCYSVDAPPRNCTDPNRKTTADMNDDGKIDGVDINYLARNARVRTGG